MQVKLLPFITGILIMLIGCFSTFKKKNETIKLTIDHYKAPCIGENIQLCYRVKKNGGSTEYMYGEIEGFTYQWGYNYILSVEKKVRKSAMTDASSITYKLKEIIKKEKVPAEATFELPLKVDDQPLIDKKSGVYRYCGKIRIETGKFAFEELSKAQTAIFKHTFDKTGLILIKLKR